MLAEHREFATAYMDDVVIFSSSWSEHVEHIDGILDTLGKAGLTANPAKCKWGGGKTIDFLGHSIGTSKMSILAHRVKALANYNKPTTKKGLRAFLGSIGFYRRYLKELATQTAILTPLMTKQAPQRVEWTAEGEHAFSRICNHFCNVCELCIPLPEDNFSLVTDASGKGIGGILQVYRDGE